MIAGILVDTDVVSFIFKGDTRADSFTPHLIGKLTMVSFMTIAELDRWEIQYNWGERKRRKLEMFLQDYVISWADRALCHEWSEVVYSARRSGRPIRTADAWIAATALLHNIPLVTRNRSNYLGVQGLTLISEMPRA